ncbi:MAG: TRAP transporter small permease subunit [Arcobacteraceae bacterium]|jgi:TRAP-type mannitol/chloroaromatic compound transport system permease small subunit|nr:TRAP transporter small permease subunit [Arcobacteraceae bacterium]
MKVLVKIKNILDSISKILGAIGAVLVVLLALLIFYNVLSRYLFSSSLIALQELEWHIFSIIFMLGFGYTMFYDAHVRVDVFYEKFSLKVKSLINIFGVLLFVIPFSIVIIYTSIEPVIYAYEIAEGSADPGGLPYRFLIKSLVLVAFFFLILSSIGFMIENIFNLVKNKES